MNGDFVAAAVVILIGACFLGMAFYILDSGGLDQDDSLDMEYEDYRTISKPVLGTEGPIEIVTIDGTTYIHAKGIGDATIVYEDGSTESFVIKKAVADMMLMCGQSNAAYYTPDVPTSLVPQIGTGFYFGTTWGMIGDTETDVTNYQFYDFINIVGNLRVGDKGPSFAKTWNEETGHKTIWICMGLGGRAMAFWNEGRIAWEKNLEIMTLANERLPEGFEIDRTFVFWSQGETDFVNDTGYENYITNWTSFHDRAPSAWGRSIDHWYLAMGSYESCGWVNDAFEELSESLEDVSIGSEIATTFTIANGLMRSDNLHYTQIGDNALAVSLARACAKDQGYSLSSAPIYLQETIVRCDVGDTVSLGNVVECRTVDNNAAKLEAVWDSSPVTSTGGIYDIAGTSHSSLLLDNTPSPLARIYVGYIGMVDGIEYCQNSAGGASVIGRSYTAADAVIPETVDGFTVTEVSDFGLSRMPWTEISIPDTVTTLGYRALYASPKLQELYIGTGLITVDWSILSATLIDNGTELTQAAWRADPSILHGTWEWNGTTANVLYKVVVP